MNTKRILLQEFCSQWVVHYRAGRTRMVPSLLKLQTSNYWLIHHQTCHLQVTITDLCQRVCVHRCKESVQTVTQLYSLLQSFVILMYSLMTPYSLFTFVIVS